MTCGSAVLPKHGNSSHCAIAVRRETTTALTWANILTVLIRGRRGHHLQRYHHMTNISSITYPHHIHKHSLPLAVPAATHCSVGWNCATAGTAVMPSPPNWASWSPLALYISTKRFILPMQNLCISFGGWRCHWARSLDGCFRVNCHGSGKWDMDARMTT